MSRLFAIAAGLRSRTRQRAQGLVEFAMFVPLMFVFLFTMLDFGFALYTNLTLEYASREGARVGAALAAGSTTLPCATVDDHVIAAVQRVLQSAGLTIELDNGGNANATGVNWIRIYKATNDVDGGGYTNLYNQWTYSENSGGTVDGTQLKFIGPVSPAWSGCIRTNGSIPDKLGVAINYTYAFRTPLASVLSLATGGGPSFLTRIVFLDKTVMNLNPTYP